MTCTLAALLAPATSSSDGVWSSFNVFSRPAVTNEIAVYDVGNDRVVALGGWLLASSGTRVVAALSLDEHPAWSPLLTLGAAPDPRDAPAGIYDPLRHRIIAFGGSNGSGYLNDVWQLALDGIPTWTQLAPAGTPPAGRANHTAIYDAANDRIIVFGGQLNTSGTTTNETWALALSPSLAWSKINPAGQPPSARAGHCAIYDPLRSRMLVFGGSGGSEVSALSLGGIPTWQLVSAVGTAPPGLTEASAAYDPTGDRMIVHGGQVQAGVQSFDTWTLSLAGAPAWDLVASATHPPGRSYHAAIVDPVRNRMIVTSGSVYGVALQADSWALTLSGPPAWSDLYTAGTSPTTNSSRNYILYAFDDVRRHCDFVESPGTDYPGYVTHSGWTASVDEPVVWKRHVAVGVPTSYTSPPVALFDPTRNRFLAHFSSDTSAWAITLGDTVVWSTITIAGANAWPLVSANRAYDSARDRWLVFGGGSASNSVYALDLSGTPTWSLVTTAGTPPLARRESAVAYDRLRDRLVIFGGDYGSGSFPTVLGDVWELSLGGTPTWTQLVPTGTPPQPRFLAGMFYDPNRDRFVMTAGKAAFNQFSDTWALSASPSPAWIQLGSGSAFPVASEDYDSVRDRGMHAFTGNDGSGHLAGDIKLLSFGLAAAPEMACPPYEHAAVGVFPVHYLLTSHQPGGETYDFQINSARNWSSYPLTGTTTIGGFSSQYLEIGIPVPDTLFNTLTAVLWRHGDATKADSCTHAIGTSSATDVPVTPASSSALTFLGAIPNPAPGRLTIGFSSPTDAPLRAEVFDVSGRRVVSRDIAGARGTQVVDLAVGRMITPGIYLIRLTQGRQVRLARAVFVR